MGRWVVLALVLAALALGYNVFWGEFVKCDVGYCGYPNPDGRFLEIGDKFVFDTSSDPSAMGFYVVAAEVNKYTSITIEGWWSYSLPRALAYVVSEKSGLVASCDTGGGSTCRVSAYLPPGVYYLVFVDAWAAQTVRVSASDSIRLANVSAVRAACALGRAGLMVGQMLTYAFDWAWGLCGS